MSIWLTAWIENVQLWELSTSIKDDLVNELHDDQTKSIVTFSSKTNSVKILCRHKDNVNETNDITIVYDIIHNTFYKHIYNDEMVDWIRLSNKTIYVNDSWLLFEIDKWDKDNLMPINFELYKWDIELWSLSKKSLLRSFVVSWLITAWNKIALELYVDWNKEKEKIVDTDVVETFSKSTDWLLRWSKVFSVWDTWSKCKFVSLRVTSTLNWWEIALWNIELQIAHLDDAEQYTKREKF